MSRNRQVAIRKGNISWNRRRHEWPTECRLAPSAVAAPPTATEISGTTEVARRTRTSAIEPRFYLTTIKLRRTIQIYSRRAPCRARTWLDCIHSGFVRTNERASAAKGKARPTTLRLCGGNRSVAEGAAKRPSAVS